MPKEIRKVWTFQSESNSHKTYESLLYSDGSTSCNCPGWTRRVAKDGSRTCKHVRLIDQGIADQECVSSHSYDATNAPSAPAIKVAKNPEPRLKMEPIKPRKILWE